MTLTLRRFGSIIDGLDAGPSIYWDMETFPPADITTNLGYCEQSEEWAESGTHSVKLTPALNTACGAYREGALTGFLGNSYGARAVNVGEITSGDNTRIMLFWYGTTQIPNYACASVRKVSGVLRWELIWYVSYTLYWNVNYGDKGIATTGRHVVELVTDDYGAVALRVDGYVVVATAPGLFVGQNMSIFGYGGFTGTQGGTGYMYVDDLRFYNRLIRFGSVERIDSTHLVASTLLSNVHGSGAALNKYFDSSDNGLTWTETDSHAPDPTWDDFLGPYGIVKCNGALYSCEQYAGAWNPAYRGKIYKRTLTGTTWTEVLDCTTFTPQFSRVFNADNTQFISNRWSVGANYQTGVVRSGWYDTLTDTMSTGGIVATYQTPISSGYTPNECSFFRNPNDPTCIVAFVRWDNIYAPYDVKASYSRSYDEGQTWSANTELSGWAQRGGMLRAYSISEEMHCCAYKKVTSTQFTLDVWRFNPDTMADIGDTEYPMDPTSTGSDKGNGDGRIGTQYNFLDIGTTDFVFTYYELESDAIPEPGPAPTVTPGASSNQIDIAPITGATQYNLYYSLTSPVLKINPILDIGTSYEHQDLSPGVEIFYAYTYIFDGVESSLSYEESGTPYLGPAIDSGAGVESLIIGHYAFDNVSIQEIITISKILNPYTRVDAFDYKVVPYNQYGDGEESNIVSINREANI